MRITVGDFDIRVLNLAAPPGSSHTVCPDDLGTVIGK